MNSPFRPPSGFSLLAGLLLDIGPWPDRQAFSRARGVEWWRPVVDHVQPDTRSWPYEAPGKRHVYDELLREVRYAVVSSESIAEEVVALGFRGRIEIIPPGLDLAVSVSHASGGCRGEPPSFRRPPGHMQKGLDILLTAMACVVDELPNTVLVVVVDGPEAAQTKNSLARACGSCAGVPRSSAATAKSLANCEAPSFVPSRTSPSGEAEGHRSPRRKPLLRACRSSRRAAVVCRKLSLRPNECRSSRG
jgi:hypothetical protein